MTKAKLQNYVNLQRERQQIEDRLEIIESALSDAHRDSLHYDEEVREKQIESLNTFRDRYLKLLEQIREEQLTIEQAIEALEPAQRTLMRYRYLDGEKWEDICELMHYSWSTVHRLHANALIEIKGGENGKQ